MSDLKIDSETLAAVHSSLVVASGLSIMQDMFAVSPDTSCLGSAVVAPALVTTDTSVRDRLRAATTALAAAADSTSTVDTQMDDSDRLLVHEMEGW